MLQTIRDNRLALVDRASAAGITLDGQPAVLAGVKNPFASVRLLSGQGGAVEYSWAAVERILAKGGAFVS